MEEETIEQSTRRTKSLTSISSNDDSSVEDGLIEDDKQVLAQENATKSSIIIKLSAVKNGEDGELHDEDTDDLEEGELKDDDDPVNQSLDTIINKNNELKKVPCKFYANGNCSWGDQCRFSHSESVNTYKPMNTPYAPRTTQSARSFQKPLYSKHYEHDNRYENQNDLDHDSRYDSYDNRFNSSYERKRRLALESAPWNDEDYVEQRKVDYRNRNHNNDNKFDYYKNHSNSSSFSDFSSSEKSFKQQPQRSPDVARKRKHSDHTSSPNLDKDHHRHYAKRSRDRNDSSPGSSFFSDSADEFDKARSPSRSPKRKRSSRSREPHPRENVRTLDQYSSKLRSKYASSNHHRRSVEREEKKPIKMTFMRKQSNLSSKDGVKDEFGSENEDEDEFDLYGSKAEVITKTATPDRSTSTSSTGNKISSTTREELLKRLKEIDQAISKKRSIAKKHSTTGN